jgi:hypothetical protein
MGHDKKKSAAPPPGPGPLPYLKKLVHPCVRLPIRLLLRRPEKTTSRKPPSLREAVFSLRVDGFFKKTAARENPVSLEKTRAFTFL